MINLKFHTPIFFRKTNKEWGISLPLSCGNNYFYIIPTPQDILIDEDNISCNGEEVLLKKAFKSTRGSTIKAGNNYIGQECLILPADYNYYAQIKYSRFYEDERVKPNGRHNMISLQKAKAGKTYKTIGYIKYETDEHMFDVICDGQIRNRKVANNGKISFQDFEMGTDQLMIPLP